jgi:hypothetical protein
MKFFLSSKFLKKYKYLLMSAALVTGLLFGFSARVYSPAYIGGYAVPIPRLIPVKEILSSNGQQKANAGKTSVLGQNSLDSPAGNNVVFSHNNIITTYFWVGEPADSDNGYIANSASAWDESWQTHYGGVDSPSPRNGYNPAGFIPKENPFYFALPYNDLNNRGKRKSSAGNCPLSAQQLNYSWCKNSWLAIRHNGKVAYAQWEDVGPFNEDDAAYVFGSALPANKQGSKAGLDVSPAVNDYLGLRDVDRCDWSFLSAVDVPNGPWKAIITSNPGDKVN